MYRVSATSRTLTPCERTKGSGVRSQSTKRYRPARGSDCRQKPTLCARRELWRKPNEPLSFFFGPQETTIKIRPFQKHSQKNWKSRTMSDRNRGGSTAPHTAAGLDTSTQNTCQYHGTRVSVIPTRVFPYSSFGWLVSVATGAGTCVVLESDPSRLMFLFCN